MKKFLAYTLAEVLIALVVVGVLGVITIRLTNTSEIQQRNKLAKVYNVLKEVDQASVALLAAQKYAPEGTYITKIKVPGKNPITDKGSAYTYEYALLNSSGSYATTSDVASIFAEYMEFEEEGLNFCSYTDYCSANDIKGGKIMGDIYVGFKVTANTSTGATTACPIKYFIPNFTKERIKNKNYFEEVDKKTAVEAGQCWGLVYVYIKSKTPTNTEGQDIFIWGLGESGVVH